MNLWIVEDDRDINRLLSTVIEEAFPDRFEISVYFSGDAAESALRNEPAPAIVLLDLMMPGRTGEELIPVFRKKGSEILVITAKNDVETLVRVFDLGARDYIAKPFRRPEVLARLQKILETRSEPSPEPLEFRGISLDPLSRKVTLDGRDVPLTQIEFDLLELFLRAPNKVFTKATLYEKVWKQPYLGDGTVAVHLSRLRGKLATEERGQFFPAVWGVGWKLYDDKEA